jgi:16S rRNA (uracil1498-N3)-methyltransferase
MNIVLIDKTDIGDDGMVRLDGAKARHILDILKAEPGKQLKVGLVNGPRGVGVVHEISDETVVMHTELSHSYPERPKIDIMLALPRPLVMKRLWAVLPSMGVGRIILTNASKVERFYFDTHWLDEKSYMPCMLEGLEQAGDTMVPDVNITRQFKIFLEDELDEVFPAGKRLVAHPGEDDKPLGKVQLGKDERVLLAIGPEGGWTEHELGLLDEHGFDCVTMGWRTLRTEAACVSALAILNSVGAASRKA